MLPAHTLSDEGPARLHRRGRAWLLMLQFTCPAALPGWQRRYQRQRRDRRPRAWALCPAAAQLHLPGGSHHRGRRLQVGLKYCSTFGVLEVTSVHVYA